jgi:alpha-tubulin suppressor-like RCC1 family protein
MPNQFLSDEFGDIEDYFVTDYWLIDQFVGDTLFTWGFNSSGQLGNNTTGSRNTPVTTFSGGTTWKQIAGGSTHTAAIKTDGSLWTWGLNSSGQLGDNTTTNRSIPVTTFAGGTDWKSVAGGGAHTLAIKTDGSLWTWGFGNSGRLGNFSTTDRSTPVTTFAGGTTWKSVACGRQHSAAIKTDGTLWLWGFNEGENLGIGLVGDRRSTPVTTFAGGNNWKQVAAGERHTVAIKTDGTLWVWGQEVSSFGQLGINIGNATRGTPVTTFAGGNNWKSVTCGSNHTTAIKTDGSLWGWGRNEDGQLGINAAGNSSRSTPVTTFAGGNNWKSAASGFGGFVSHVAAIKTDGSLWTWGRNADGQLGTNDSTQRSTPVTTFAGGNNWKSAACGYRHTIAIKSGLNVDLS